MGTSIANRALFRPKTTKKALPSIGTFDIETRGLGGDYIIGAICDPNESVSYHSDKTELLNVLLSRKYRNVLWYAHNGGNYDFKYFVDLLVQMKTDGKVHTIKFIETNGKFIQIQVWRTEKDKNPVTLRDSFALIPASLDAVTKAFSPDETKGKIDFDKENFNPDNAEHMEYLRKDVVTLRKSLLSFMRTCLDNFGVVPGLTAASTAIKAWKQTIPEGEIYFRTNKKVEDFVRNAYLGGMVYIKQVNTEYKDMVKLDISGAYGYAMKTYEMPLGTAVHTDEYEADKIGFYKCKIRAPKYLEKYIIGKRTKTGVIWARGAFIGYIDSYTYEYALKRGYSIEILEGYYFQEKKTIFKDFIEKCELLEFAHKGNALGDTAKLMRNSLYGKFGTNPDKKEYGIDMPESDGWRLVPDNNGLPCEHLCERDITIEAAYIMPHWAATITALVRIYLDTLDAKLEYAFVYNDTDSSVVPRAVYEAHKDKLPSEAKYGRFKVDAEYTSFLVKGPKAYLGEHIDGTHDIKAKGIPRRRLTPETMKNGGTVEFVSLNGIIPMMKGNKPIAHVITRTVTDIANSAHWTLQDDGITVLPLELREYET